jgi:hypothetical protein
MNGTIQLPLARLALLMTSCRITSFLLLISTCASAHAQGEIPSGTLSSSGIGPYSYSLSFSDAANATSPIGSVWYAWVPGAFYLPGPPRAAVAPPGWSVNVSGHSIQFVADSAANYIHPGQSLSGFSYQAAFSPAQLASAPNSGVSVVYSGGLLSDFGTTFTVKTLAVPEPCTLPLVALGAFALTLSTKRRWS